MTRTEITYLLPYILSILLSMALLVIIRNKREANGSTAFFYYVAGQTLAGLGFLLELTSSGLQQKIFWENLQWIASCLPIIAFPIFTAGYTGYRFKNRWILVETSVFAPVVFIILIATDAYHHWVYQNLRLEPSGPFEVLTYDNSPVMAGFSLYVAAIILLSCFVLYNQMRRPHNPYRVQTGLIIIGAMIPLAGSIPYIAELIDLPHRGTALVASGIGSLLLAWGFYRFQIFEVEAIDRERVFEAMVEPLVILDNKNIIVDINSSMLALLGKTEREVIGLPAKDVFQDFPIPIKSYTQVTYARAEAEFKIGGNSVHYELTVWPLYNKRKELTGRIYISHDITALKELENELRKLNTELENRVQSRTRELAEAYESMLEGFARALELRDKETEGHSRRVTETALKIANQMGITGEALEDIRSGAILHDIGKISIPDEILHKQGKLTPEERLIIEQHPETAYKLLSRIPFLSKAIEIPYCHHEKWDGTGYPRKLAGLDIPLSARIFAIADVWDALSNDRPYNKAWSREQILEYFKEQTGKHFDPSIVNVFFSMTSKGEI